MLTELSAVCVLPHQSIQDVVVQMDRNRLGIALVIDRERRLVGTVTDGDVRRAVLAKRDFEQPITALLVLKAGGKYAQPVTAPAGQEPDVYLTILKQHNLLYLPLLDDGQHVVGLITLDQLVPDRDLALQAVVMAGGRGQRLSPLTEDMPKPMLKVGDRPILEVIITQLREAGIKQVKVTTHHKAEKIAEYFGDGSRFGVALSYVEEDQPLGTVGGLGLTAAPQETTLVINGDILTQVNFRAMLLYHREHHADLTMAVRHYDVQVPYGVVECEGPMVRRVSEKPVFGFFVNAGIYLLEPSVYRLIPSGERLDMTNLIQQLLEAGRRVASFPIRESWLDIGQREDYEQAQEAVKSWETSQS